MPFPTDYLGVRFWNVQLVGDLSSGRTVHHGDRRTRRQRGGYRRRHSAFATGLGRDVLLCGFRECTSERAVGNLVTGRSGSLTHTGVRSREEPQQRTSRPSLVAMTPYPRSQPLCYLSVLRVSVVCSSSLFTDVSLVCGSSSLRRRDSRLGALHRAKRLKQCAGGRHDLLGRKRRIAQDEAPTGPWTEVHR